MTHLFEIQVERDAVDGIWTGMNERIGLFVEASSYDALVEESWLLVPDLVELGRIAETPEQVNLRFCMTTSCPA